MYLVNTAKVRQSVMLKAIYKAVSGTSDSVCDRVGVVVAESFKYSLQYRSTGTLPQTHFMIQYILYRLSSFLYVLIVLIVRYWDKNNHTEHLSSCDVDQHGGCTE